MLYATASLQNSYSIAQRKSKTKKFCFCISKMNNKCMNSLAYITAYDSMAHKCMAWHTKRETHTQVVIKEQNGIRYNEYRKRQN